MTFSSTSLIKPVNSAGFQTVYADQYSGEWINYQLGANIDRKFYKPTNTFYRQGGRAIVLGNGPSRLRYPLAKLNISNQYKRLKNYNVLYGCNYAFSEDGDLDFLILTNKLLSTMMPKDLYSICYATADIQRLYPGAQLVPLNQGLDSGTAAAFIACFHGASEVFLFGFDGTPEDVNQNIHAGKKYYAENGSKLSDLKWQENLRSLMIAYPDVKFHRVDSNPPNARMLSVIPNYDLITFNEFVSLADL